LGNLAEKEGLVFKAVSCLKKFYRISDFKSISEKPFWPPHVLLLKDFLILQ